MSEVSMDQTVLQPVQSTDKVTALEGCSSARGRDSGVFRLRLRTLPHCHVARGKSLHLAALLASTSVKCGDREKNPWGLSHDLNTPDLCGPGESLAPQKCWPK